MGCLIKKVKLKGKINQNKGGANDEENSEREKNK